MRGLRLGILGCGGLLYLERWPLVSAADSLRETSDPPSIGAQTRIEKPAQRLLPSITSRRRFFVPNIVHPGDDVDFH
jgi:hypothetical protein